jgi:hypothetical protein
VKELAGHPVTLILSLFLGGCIGYGLAMRRITLKEEVHYVRGETVISGIEFPAAGIELLPDSLRYGLKFADIKIPPDIVFPDSVDLRPAAYDWNLERKYEEKLFDNTYGKMNVQATVQYNRLQDLQTVFVPVRKEIVRYVTPAWEPYALMQYGTLGVAGIGGGVFHGKAGCHIMYMTDFRRNGVGAGVTVRF